MDDRWRVLAVLTLARVAMGFQLQVVGSTAFGLGSAFGLDAAGIGLLIGLFLPPGVVVALPRSMIGARFAGLLAVAETAQPTPEPHGRYKTGASQTRA